MAKEYTLDGDKLKVTEAVTNEQDYDIEHLLMMKQMHEETIVREQASLAEVDFMINEYNKLKV